MARGFLFGLISFCLLAVAGCAGGSANSGLGKASKGVDLAAAKASAPGEGLPAPDSTSSVQIADFLISPLDLLEIRVFGVEKISGDFQVDPEGNLEMPLVGKVVARGRGTFDLGRVIEERLSQAMLQDPKVVVRVKQTFNRNVTVDGSVSKPGVYPVTGSVSLMQAVALAGGPSDSANIRRVAIFRTVEGERRAAVFDLRAIRNGEMADPQVFGNDVVVVDGSSTSRAYREVMRSVPLLGLFVYRGGF